MARVLYAPTEDFIKLERTRLSADVVAGTNVTLPLESSDGLSANDFIVIGHEGNELSELQQINQSVSSDTSARVATLKFNHVKGEPVTKYRYNQRKFYGSLTETGTYTELTADGSPKAIQADDPQGTLLEYTGDEGYLYFKATYYNSVQALETDIADAMAVSADESLRYTSLYLIRKHAGMVGNPYYSELLLEVKRKQAENEVQSALAGRYTLPLTEIPALIQYVTTILAAGYIDYEEFGKDGEGVKWLGEARAILKGFQKGERLLIGSDGTELGRRDNADRLSGIPNDSTTEERIFKIDDRF